MRSLIRHPWIEQVRTICNKRREIIDGDVGFGSPPKAKGDGDLPPINVVSAAIPRGLF